MHRESDYKNTEKKIKPSKFRMNSTDGNPTLGWIGCSVSSEKNANNKNVHFFLKQDPLLIACIL